MKSTVSTQDLRCALEEFAAAIGSANVSTDADTLAAYEDPYPVGSASAAGASPVLTAGSADEVQAIALVRCDTAEAAAESYGKNHTRGEDL